MKSILAFFLLFSAVVISAGTFSGLSYDQNAFAISSAPDVTVTSPANGATLSSNAVIITGTASSSSNTISNVQVSVDGAPYVTATGTTSWSYAATGLANGLHSITAKATDGQGLIGYSTNVVASSGVPVGNGGQELAFDPDNGNIYVANYNPSYNIVVVSGSTNQVLATIADSGGPTGIAYDSVNHYVYTANYDSGTVTMINTANNQVIGSPISVGSHPFGVAYVPNGNIYVANTGSNTVSVINPSTNTVVATIPVGSHPQDFAYDSTSQLLYMTNQGSNNVSVINPSTNTVVAIISVGISPRGIAYDPVNGDMYIANFNSNTVSIIDTSTNTVSSIPTGSSGGPNGVAFDPVNGFVYVPDFSSATTRLNVIDSSTNAFINPVTLHSASYYYYAIFDPINSDIYITSGSNAAIIQTQTQFTVTAQTTTTSVSSSQNPSTFGQSVTITASVSPNTATGTVTFTVDGTPQTPVAVSSGQATFSSSSLSVGPHTITAAYSGDASDLSSASSALTQTVNQITTTTTLASSQNPSTFGQSVTITASVSPNTATGTVTFTVDGTPQTPVAVSSGQATFSSSSLSVGPHTITAAYSGDTNDAASASSLLIQTINKITTTTTLSSSSSTVNFGQQVSLNATVSPTVPNGETMTFYDGAAPIGTGTTSSGIATLVITLPAGTHSITASYPGDANDLASTSSPVSVTVLTLMQEKQSVITSLQSLTVVSHDDKQDIKQAIEAVQDSVNPNLWQSDGIHLVVKTGDKVFDNEKQAADQLKNMIDDKKESSSIVTALQNDMSTLTDVDQKLANTAISDANTAANGYTGDSAKDVKQDIVEAQAEMTKASDEISKGQFAAGIEHYGNAWKHAEDAITDTKNNHDDHDDDNNGSHENDK